VGEWATSIFDVARYILHAIGKEISVMKLQKLCYYCQAWHLVWRGKPLFLQEFEARENGPVCRELFELHKGWFGIREENIPARFCNGGELAGEISDHVDKVLDGYGLYDGAELSEISQREAPWKQTKRNAVISRDLMKAHYASL
jgi:uncharacterized phage-associated protein